MAVPLIEVKDLVMTYDDKVVLDRLNLTIERGETCVLIGGSGSGKSTLARLIVGLERPTSGQILIDGLDIAQLSERDLRKNRDRFAVVFQKHALLDSLTVFDNVAFPLREHEHLDEELVRQKVTYALRELGIEEAAQKLPGELSGGMAKRVGIARAVVVEPEILVYDEPTSGLDPVSSRVVDGLIDGMRERHCVTSIVITHDMVTAYEVADKVALLADGVVAAQGPPDEVFRAHGADIERFAVSSGVDVTQLPQRRERKTPAEIRAAWEATHPHHPDKPRGWWS